MRFLREEGITNDLPTRRVKAPRGGKPLPKSLTLDEVESLIDHVTDASSQLNSEIEQSSNYFTPAAYAFPK